MITYAKLKNYNITYDETLGKFFVSSKEDVPHVGGFDTAAMAIEFAEKLYVDEG